MKLRWNDHNDVPLPDVRDIEQDIVGLVSKHMQCRIEDVTASVSTLVHLTNVMVVRR